MDYGRFSEMDIRRFVSRQSYERENFCFPCTVGWRKSHNVNERGFGCSLKRAINKKYTLSLKQLNCLHFCIIYLDGSEVI